MNISGGRFLLTGGNGLIGLNIADELLKKGAAEIVLFDNMVFDAATPPTDKRIRLVRGTILRLDQLLEATKGIDGIFHLAAYLTFPLSKDPGDGIDVNVTGCRNVLDAARWNGVKKVVFSSSIAVYGGGNSLTTEGAPFERQDYSPFATIYAATKIIGEELGEVYFTQYGLDFISLRYSSVYGVGQHGRAVNALLLTEPLEAIRRGKRPEIRGDGSEVHDYINVIDVAEANVRAMESDVRRGKFTIATGESTNLTTVVSTLLELFGSSLEPVYTAQKGVTSSISSSVRFDVSKAERELGWKARIGIREGLASLKAWRDEVDPVRLNAVG